MRYAFIRDNEQRYPVTVLCKVFKVSVCVYFGWKVRPESKRAIENRRLLEEIKDIHKGRKRSYGSPRVHGELLARGITCSLNRVARIMRENSIASISKRKFKQTTDSGHNYPIAPNLLDRKFDVPEYSELKEYLLENNPEIRAIARQAERGLCYKARPGKGQGGRRLV